MQESGNNMTVNTFDPKLPVDAESEIKNITARIKEAVAVTFKKRGAVIGISGGIDSSVVLSLAVKALGPEKVIGLMMPERDSDARSEVLARELAQSLHVRTFSEVMSPALQGLGCYQRRDEAVKRIFPDFTDDGSVKITLPQTDYTKDQINFYQITIVLPDGMEKTKRLALKEYLQIVAASNFKQRTRMAMLYYYAELHNYAVISTANKDEHDLGFIVKFGDGAGDIFPLRHLFKIQVYQLADKLDIPLSVRKRTPTSDTYSANQTQKEFFFGLDFDKLDPVWFGWENNVPDSVVAKATGLSETQVKNVIKDIKRKINATAYLRMQPL
jgi:NAD+ synthase